MKQLGHFERRMTKLLGHWIWAAAALLFLAAMSIYQGDLVAPSWDEWLTMLGSVLLDWTGPAEFLEGHMRMHPSHMPLYYILLSLWGFGAQMIIFLAGLQGIPEDLYEAAAIDGGTGWQRLVYITIPLMTPTIFFNLLMGLIGGFQVFEQVFILIGTHGGPLQAGLVYMLHVYNKAFRDFEFGYAAALSVILFLIIFVLTVALVYTSNRWVFYGDAQDDET